MQYKANQKLKSQLIALVAALIAFVFLYSLFEYQRQKDESNAYLDATAYGSVLRAEVDRELNSLLFISNGLSSFIKVYRHTLETDKMQAILADLWIQARHVRNLAIAVGYKLRYVYPEKPNEKILGVDYREVPAQWPKVKLAIQHRQGVLDGPLDLMQGGSGMIYRFPIFIDGEYWGMLSTVIDTDAFLKDTFKTVQRQEFDFAIRTADNRHVFYGNPALFQQKHIYIQESIVPNGKWEWAIENRKIHDLRDRRFGVLLSLLLSILAGWLVYLFAKERYYLSEGALMDSLTGLPNRRLLESRLNYVHAEAERFNKMFGLMALDVDHFKSINDNYGHDVGDEVIKQVANALKASIRDVDTVSRLGGDEFVIVVKDQHSRESLIKIAGKILQVFKKPMLIHGQEVTVHLSIGLTLFDPAAGVSLKQLSKQADIALYHAKQKGRNTYSFWQ
ncbi:diguanylate cyclase (GGDEF) domain-containing protein [Methylophilus rhizosphaerae]|uniref:Diguanylate cyclase (GGDEF) domain-containing protein n=1 Tax=Methylophilus rhizosphaerae TaxID=492660 RepID=A0A1G9CTS2_9PROT|nr:diguanylate cyclase [Methylophilus rhizosphaerae]SDK54794.1 diguanylate cyclase (GGDEF) domain-containing protein [Methylophilus rhizosphaerae]